MGFIDKHKVEEIGGWLGCTFLMGTDAWYGGHNHIVVSKLLPLLGRRDRPFGRIDFGVGRERGRASIFFRSWSALKFSAICSRTRRLGVITNILLARNMKAQAIRTVVFPEPVGIVTIAGALAPKKWAAMACAAAN